MEINVVVVEGLSNGLKILVSRVMTKIYKYKKSREKRNDKKELPKEF